MTTVTFFAAGNTNNALFFIRFDSRRLTPGGCFPQRSLYATNRVRIYNPGDFAEPFPPPLRSLLWPRRSSLGRAPQRAARPLIPGRARPAPARLHLLWRSRAYAFRADLQQKNKRLSIAKRLQTAYLGHKKRLLQETNFAAAPSNSNAIDKEQIHSDRETSSFFMSMKNKPSKKSAISTG